MCRRRATASSTCAASPESCSDRALSDVEIVPEIGTAVVAGVADVSVVIGDGSVVTAKTVTGRKERLRDHAAHEAHRKARQQIGAEARRAGAERALHCARLSYFGAGRAACQRVRVAQRRVGNGGALRFWRALSQL